MGSIFLPKPLQAAALGGVVLLAGFGVQNATADQTSMVSTAAATRNGSAEARFLRLADLIAQSCAPAAPNGAAAVASKPTLDSTQPILVNPVRLTAAERCAAQSHQLRIHRAFSGKGTATYAKMRDRLTGLNYPAARIHRMRDFAGKPVVRLDLRVGAGHLALEVTGLRNAAMIEAFGAPKGVSVTKVRLKRHLDPPTS